MQRLFVILVGVLALFLVQDAQTCNEAVCGSIVSKCLLTQSCKCDFKKDCSCCKECSICLSILYEECCSCVGMCPQPNDTAGALNQQSHVEDFTTTIPALFEALTSSDDSEERWTQITFPVDWSSPYGPKNVIKYHMQSAEQEVIHKPNITTFNCTVAFVSKCLSWEKCKKHCQSMGATQMRWFHDGCCECIGNHCIDYGIKESKCKYCSNRSEATNSIEFEDDYEYGEADEYEDT